MESIKNILSPLIKLSKLASEKDEYWGYIKFYGSKTNGLDKTINELEIVLENLGCSQVLSIEINNSLADEYDLLTYFEDSSTINNWSIHLNKEPIIGNVQDGKNYNFFLEIHSCKRWLENLNPLLKECPINYYSSLCIVINDLKECFGGPNISFISPSNCSQIISGANYNLPNWEVLRETIHFISQEELSINCNSWVINGNFSSDLERIFISKASLPLSICLVDEYYNKNKVIIDGIKRIAMRIAEDGEQISKNFYLNLIELIEWMYADRISVRRKLFNERLTLDIDCELSLINGLKKGMYSAFIQAQERYNFVVIERKDAYVKELKELLKDIRTQSELYSGKIRALLSNFLRDLLAAILLIGFTIFTKISENINLSESNLLSYVFNGLAIYYLLSIVMQSIIDIFDIQVSKKEMLYWKNATKELLPEKEFKHHIDSSLKGRRLSLKIIYPIIALFYLLIAFACFYYPFILDFMIKKP